jgi:hypothetical protein
MIPVSELLALYAEIESGDVRLTALQDPQNVYAGNVVYVSSNGWTLTIFNDANGCGATLPNAEQRGGPVTPPFSHRTPGGSFDDPSAHRLPGVLPRLASR